jgi:hypothetical protein
MLWINIAGVVLGIALIVTELRRKETSYVRA